MNDKGVPVPNRPKDYNFQALYCLGAMNQMEGKPVSGGFVQFFQSNTDTPVQPYADPEMAIPHPIPTFLNMNGEANIYLAPGQRIRVQIYDDTRRVIDFYEVEV